MSIAVQMRTRVPITSRRVLTRLTSASSASHEQGAATVLMASDNAAFDLQRKHGVPNSTMASTRLLTPGLMSRHSMRSVSNSRSGFLPSQASSYRFFFSKSKGANSMQQQFDAALIVYALKPNLERVQQLLKAGANVNARNSEGRTPLIMACIVGDLEVVRELFKHDELDANVHCKQGATALIIASDKGHLDIVRELLKHDKVDVNLCAGNGTTALMIASIKGHMDVLRELLKHDKVDVNAKYKLDRTVLMVACNTGNVDVVRELMKHDKLDVNARDDLGYSPLMIASFFGHLEVVRELLKHDRLEVQAKSGVGATSLTIAVVKGHKDVARELLNREVLDASKRDSS